MTASQSAIDKINVRPQQRECLNVFKWIILFSVVVLPFFSSAQDIDAKSPKPDKKATKQQHKAEKKKEQKKIQQENSEAQNLKESERLQTKEVRKRMKKSRRKADAFNNHRREFFLKRWFRKKH